jgi:hypothetical protein
MELSTEWLNDVDRHWQFVVPVLQKKIAPAEGRGDEILDKIGGQRQAALGFAPNRIGFGPVRWTGLPRAAAGALRVSASRGPR